VPPGLVTTAFEMSSLTGWLWLGMTALVGGDNGPGVVTDPVDVATTSDALPSIDAGETD
jgi:hypothetical protein